MNILVLVYMTCLSCCGGVVGGVGDNETDFNLYENENTASGNPDIVSQCQELAKKQWSKSNSTLAGSA